MTFNIFKSCCSLKQEAEGGVWGGGVTGGHGASSRGDRLSWKQLTVPTHTLSITPPCCISEHHTGSNTALATYFKRFIASLQKEGSQKAGTLPVLFNPEALMPSTGLAYNRNSTHFF